LSQAEHGPDSQVILATNSQKLAQATAKEIKRQMTGLPERARKTAALALRTALFIITGSLDKAVDFANSYAPEHLILNIKNPERYVAKIKNAGSVFLGPYSPESAGDYASGTNHILPTSGWAKSYGGVSVDSFVKKISFQKLNKQGLDKIAKAIAVLADIEQMPAHKNAVKVRTTKLC
ncbi:MAG: histidinol dehydrogenase, partial [Patescibacteria group bacterium]